MMVNERAEIVLRPLRYPKTESPKPRDSPRFDRGRRTERARELERQSQAERHHSGCRSEKKLRLAKSAARKVGIDTIKVRMVKKVLGLSAESHVCPFRELEVL